MMSEPPMNSPLMYSCGMVGQLENSLMPWRMSVVLQHVHGCELAGAAGFEQLNRFAGKAALRELRRAFHEQNDRIVGNGFLNEVVYGAHEASLCW